MKTSVRAIPPKDAVEVIHRVVREKPSNVVEPRATMITASRPGRGSTRASPARKGLVTTRPSRSRVNGAIPAINPRYTPNASPFSSQTLRP